MRQIALTVVVAVLALGQYAHAVGPLANCGPDVEKFCREVPPGGGRVMRCLREHGEQLSKPCKGALGIPPKSGATTNPCRDDVIRLCPEAGRERDRDKIKQCLQVHAGELSDGCKTAIVAQGAAR